MTVFFEVLGAEAAAPIALYYLRPITFSKINLIRLNKGIKG